MPVSVVIRGILPCPPEAAAAAEAVTQLSRRAAEASDAACTLPDHVKVFGCLARISVILGMAARCAEAAVRERLRRVTPGRFSADGHVQYGGYLETAISGLSETFRCEMFSVVGVYDRVSRYPAGRAAVRGQRDLTQALGDAHEAAAYAARLLSGFRENLAGCLPPS